MAAAYQPSRFYDYVSYVLLILVACLTNGSLKHRHDVAVRTRSAGSPKNKQIFHMPAFTYLDM